MVDAVLATYRTNFFMPNRWGLSLRVDPRVLMTPEELQVCAPVLLPAVRTYDMYHRRWVRTAHVVVGRRY